MKLRYLLVSNVSPRAVTSAERPDKVQGLDKDRVETVGEELGKTSRSTNKLTNKLNRNLPPRQ